MVVTSKLMSIGIIALSITVGFIYFYIMNDLPKQQKKKHIGDLTSQLINFIIFIWIGKIILNFSIFIKDPLAILAYPSNSDAFYLAVLFSAIILVYRSKRNQMDVPAFMESFLSVFLTASLLYEFIQLIWNNNTYAFGYLVLLCVLLVLFLLIQGRVTTSSLLMIMLTGWSSGMMLIAYTQPIATVFGYMMDPWFVGLLFITGSIVIVKKRKGIKNGWN
ncbi:hypothetical protein EU245_00400 [Lentibacillus lipolyticus]|nr:hypothetical protein EU245_00400 [Lentibacillus lipolyticus]